MASIQKDLPTGHGGADRLRRHRSTSTPRSTMSSARCWTRSLIVVVVIFLFLGSFRSVLVPVVAIPISLIGGVFLMQVFGFTINLLTLLAIVLSVGLVVDDAIVVVENVERHLAEGRTPLNAALLGAPRAGGPDHRDDDHPGGGLRADRLPGRRHRLPVPGIRLHARRHGGDLGRRRPDALADDVAPPCCAAATTKRAWPGRITHGFARLRGAVRPRARP